VTEELEACGGSKSRCLREQTEVYGLLDEAGFSEELTRAGRSRSDEIRIRVNGSQSSNGRHQLERLFKRTRVYCQNHSRRIGHRIQITSTSQERERAKGRRGDWGDPEPRGRGEGETGETRDGEKGRRGDATIRPGRHSPCAHLRVARRHFTASARLRVTASPVRSSNSLLT